jgi:hypothetical protein
MTTVVINIRDPASYDLMKAGHYIYCGRGSDFGNRYQIGVDGTREEVIAKHKADVLADPEMVEKVRRELTGGVLGCFCKPKACHCDTYVEICDGTP